MEKLMIGVGGGGSNTVTRLFESMQHEDMAVINSDASSLGLAKVARRLQIGHQTVRGLGCGGNPEVGRRAAEESVDAIRAFVQGAELVILVAGLGGGSGTGATPVIARVAREAGAVVAAIVSMPFAFEGRRRTQQAEEALEVLVQEVSLLATYRNDELLNQLGKRMSMQEAHALGDDVARAMYERCDRILAPDFLPEAFRADLEGFRFKVELSPPGSSRPAPALGS